MSARTVLRLCATLAMALAAATTYSDQPPAQRARTFATLPNWSGIWQTEAAARLLSTGKLEAPALWGKPPYNAEWEKKSGAPNPVRQTGAPLVDLPPALKACEPAGFPAIMEAPVPDYLFEILVTPEQTLLVSSDGAARHIYTDGRKHPRDEDLWPTPEGDSIGHWEGQTLVIDTLARKAGRLGPLPGAADLSDQARFTERLHLIDADSLQNDMTIDDPQRFAHPWQLSIRYARAKDVDRMIAVNCRENDRNPVVNGGFIITPP